MISQIKRWLRERKQCRNCGGTGNGKILKIIQERGVVLYTVYSECAKCLGTGIRR